VSDSTTLTQVRRTAVLALAIAGLGLFGTGVRGLAQVDGRLADGTERPVTQEVKQALPDDCPWQDRRDQRRL
jgi:hypothetical protein